MTTKRIVPSVHETVTTEFVFADGARQIPAFERLYLADALVEELTGKRLNQLTYQEWQEQVFSVMQVRNQFVREVTRQRAAHFSRY